MRMVGLLLTLILTAPAWAQRAEVDPFAGADAGGNTLPGACVPFGLVQFSPDTNSPSPAGYNSSQYILGFSYTHVSGTGGWGKYGNFMVTPWSGEPRLSDLASGKGDESASPGFYQVELTRTGVQAQLTATRRVGFSRFTFPPGRPACLVLDAGSVVGRGENRPPGQRPLHCRVRFVPPDRLEGGGEFVGGWNAAPYKLYFSAQFDQAYGRHGTWTGTGIDQGSAGSHPGHLQQQAGVDQAEAEQAGAYAVFAPGQVQMKLAVSFVSVEQARANLSEVSGWDFAAVRRQAEAQWDEVLGKIKLVGGTPEQRGIFYTALYHCHTMPHDASGENVWWNSSEPHYEDFYCLWDTFRTLHPLLTLIQPQRQRDMLRSLLDTYVHTGWLPDARIAGANGLTQGGSNGDVLVADAVVKGLGGFDLETAYQAVRKDAEVESPRPLHEGRQLEEYRRLGYLSSSSDRSVTRTLEYAYNDFCAAAVAEAAGRSQQAEEYRRRSLNWRNLWDAQSQAVRPRHPDGKWLEPFVRTYANGSWNGPFYEGSAWQYSTYVPHDVAGLSERLGGPAGLVAWLDEFFDQGAYTQGNEPDILAPWLYIHAGRPDKTADRVRAILQESYHSGRAGLPGNDDAGAMSSWYVFAALGLYPNAGQPFYYLGSPIFPESTMELEGGKRFRILAPGTSDRARYVCRATLNGQPLDRAWLRHSELAAGGELRLEMGETPGDWATSGFPVGF
jgi:predicted alpha-1,2-mannosidase